MLNHKKLILLKELDMGAIESKVVVEVEKVSSFVPRVDYVLEKPRVEPV